MRGYINRPTLITLAKIEACRTGLALDDLGAGYVALRDIQHDTVENLKDADACAILCMLRKQHINEHVARAANLPKSMRDSLGIRLSTRSR